VSFELEKRQLPVDVELRDLQVGIVHGRRVCGVYHDSSMNAANEPKPAAERGPCRQIGRLVNPEN
jgi:hypothetical protein